MDSSVAIDSIKDKRRTNENEKSYFVKNYFITQLDRVRSNDSIAAYENELNRGAVRQLMMISIYNFIPNQTRGLPRDRVQTATSCLNSF